MRGCKREDPEMPGRIHMERNPGGDDRREDQRNGRRPWRSTTRRRPEFLGGDHGGALPGDVRSSWEESSSEEQTPSQS
ncbi:hypothetical protein NDU88_002207 [Pleurodeles waltl]|uniref:Uncharacterized protein n=1 Tax=Pleurodeles waltl TaxID=8319 RepID=A0AAV7UAK8_PLEWA|nr:hypothetical protein NDU88_002207 [Pleurodeles waltl]